MPTFTRRDAIIVERIMIDLSLGGEQPKQTKKVAKSLSGVACWNNYLFVAGDEASGLERLQTVEGGYGARTSFNLKAIFDLPGNAEEEADIESLSIAGNWLWIVTSHARTRVKLKDNIRDFARIKFHPERYVLGCIPLATGEHGEPIPVRRDDDREAWCIPLSETGNALTDALAQDPHLSSSLKIPAKENGLDIEGIAVHEHCLVLGLRGPVLREHAVLLVFDLSGNNGGGLRAQAGHSVSYRKIFVHLDGLGVRDLCRWDQDLLILAGPTMPISAPYRLYRIAEFFKRASLPNIPAADYLCDLPLADGNPEGLSPQSNPDEFLVVADSPPESDDLQVYASVISLWSS